MSPYDLVGAASAPPPARGHVDHYAPSVGLRKIVDRSNTKIFAANRNRPLAEAYAEYQEFAAQLTRCDRTR